jgi:putative transposase
MRSVVVSVLAMLRGVISTRAAMHVEVLALRHQLLVLGRSRPRRLRLGRADRWLWACVSRVWSGWRMAVVIVKPETVVAWHRQGFRLLWTFKSRRRVGRPPVAADARALIRKLAQENPLWGAPRIHGELLTLGVQVSQATVAKYLAGRGTPPSQSWRTFLTNHVQQIVAADFFIVRPPRVACCSCSSSWRTTAVESCMSPSRRIRRPPGPRNNSANRFRGIRRRGISFTTAILRFRQ